MALEYNGWTAWCDERIACTGTTKIYGDFWDTLDEDEVYERWERDGGKVKENSDGDWSDLICPKCVAEQERVDKIKESGVLYNDKCEPLDTPLF